MKFIQIIGLWPLALPASAAKLQVDLSDASAYATINAAIESAQSGDTISIAPGTYAECVLPYGKSLTFEGSGPDSTRIDGTGLCDNTLSIWNGETVQMSEISLQNRGGRGVYNYYSTLTLHEVQITDSGNEGWYGGGLYLDGGTTRIEESTISDNTASLGGAVYIYAYAQLDIIDSSISRNQAQDVGGAIYIYYDTQINLDDSTFESNTSGSSGGAIYAYWEVDLTTIDTHFINNTAGGAGGAIEFDWYGDLSMSGGRISGNSAASSGGAVYSYVPTNVVLDDTEWSNNTANGEGGALGLYWPTVVQITDSVFSENQAAEGYAGGALQLYVAGTVDLKRNLFCANRASYGGAISDQWTSTVDTLTNNRFVENEAILGGGIYRYAVYLGEIVNNTFVGNSGTSWGGAYYAGYSYADFRNNAVAHTLAGNGIYAEDTSSLSNSTIQYGGWWENTVIDAGGYFYVGDGVDGNLLADPGFVEWSADGDCSNDDLRLASGSAFRDAGDTQILDPDGSRSDIGAYGGPGVPEDWYVEEEDPKDTATTDTGSNTDSGLSEDSGHTDHHSDTGDQGHLDGQAEGELNEGDDDLQSCGCVSTTQKSPAGTWGLLFFLAWIGQRRKNHSADGDASGDRGSAFLA